MRHHSLSQCVSQPGLGSVAVLAAGAGTAAVSTQNRRAQGPHLHPQISKAPIMHASVPHSLSQRMSQPGLASLELCTAGASTAAVPAEEWRAQGPHLHPDDQDTVHVQECAS